MDFDDIVEPNRSVVEYQFSAAAVEYYLSGDSPARDVGRTMEILEMTGAVEWSGHRESVSEWGRRYSTGGTLALTALGRHALPGLLADAGLSLRSAADLADADLDALIAAMGQVPPEQHSDMLAAWQPAMPESERAGAVAAMISGADYARTRLIGMRLLGLFDAEVAEPHMRQLLDTDAAGHAAIWLLENGLADPDTVGDSSPGGDGRHPLRELIDEPDILCEQFLVARPEAMLEFFWRHRAPETAEYSRHWGGTCPIGLWPNWPARRPCGTGWTANQGR